MIYVASPYSSDTRIVESQRAAAVARYTSHLIRQGQAAFSPIAHGHFIEECVVKGTAPTYRDWLIHGINMLRISEEVHVFMLDGWQESQGVSKEISFAENKQLNIEYISPIGYRRHNEFMSVV